MEMGQHAPTSTIAMSAPETTSAIHSHPGRRGRQAGQEQEWVLKESASFPEVF
jgi:hypothetical protein